MANKGGWGSALPQKGAGGGGNANQFDALRNNQRKNAGGAAPAAGPKEVILNDLQQERPLWWLSCYGHQREGRNDLTGDISFEEARWKQLQDRLAGKPDQQMATEFKSAVATKERDFAALIRIVKSGAAPPSLGGSSVGTPDPWTVQLLGVKTVFGTAVGARPGPAVQTQHYPPPPPLPQQQQVMAFGQQAAPAAVGGAFGAAPSAAAAKPLLAFGAAAGSRAPTVFGNVASATFGTSISQPVAAPSNAFAPPSSTGGGFFGTATAPHQPTPAFGAGPSLQFGACTAPSTTSGFGVAAPTLGFSTNPTGPALFGASPAAKTLTFGIVPGGGGASNSLGTAVPLQASASSPFTGLLSSTAPLPSSAASPASGGIVFGQPTVADAATASPSAAIGSSQASAAQKAAAMEAYQAPAFVLGQIPEEPPPLEMCR